MGLVLDAGYPVVELRVPSAVISLDRIEMIFKAGALRSHRPGNVLVPVIDPHAAVRVLAYELGKVVDWSDVLARAWHPPIVRPTAV